LQDSIRLRLKIPLPGTLAFFVMLITALAFILGQGRAELVLTLLGAIFLIVLVYSFLSVLVLGLLYRKKSASLAMTIIPDKVNIGDDAQVLVKSLLPGNIRFRTIPMVNIRCELCIETKDRRVIRYYADLNDDEAGRICIKERGVYLGERDRLIIFDAIGFFRFYLPLRQSAGPRLFALPNPADEARVLQMKTGGAMHRNEARQIKTDELIDHRPYYPGDDPRRINWKLYSHSPLGELVIRKEDSESPPHSRTIILIDTEVDPSLYSVDEGRRAVDLLCESVLSAALELSASGFYVCIGYTGSKTIYGLEEGKAFEASDLASCLARPAAVFLTEALPLPPEDRPVLVFAIPGRNPEERTLASFCTKRGRAGTEIVFLYRADSYNAIALEDAARLCTASYNKRNGVFAEKAGILREDKNEA